MSSHAYHVKKKIVSTSYASPKLDLDVDPSLSPGCGRVENGKAGQRAASGQSCNSARWKPDLDPFARVPGACTPLSKVDSPEIAIRIPSFVAFQRVFFFRKGKK